MQNLLQLPELTEEGIANSAQTIWKVALTENC